MRGEPARHAETDDAAAPSFDGEIERGRYLVSRIATDDEHARPGGDAGFESQPYQGDDEALRRRRPHLQRIRPDTTYDFTAGWWHGAAPGILTKTPSKVHAATAARILKRRGAAMPLRKPMRPPGGLTTARRSADIDHEPVLGLNFPFGHNSNRRPTTAGRSWQSA